MSSRRRPLLAAACVASLVVAVGASHLVVASGSLGVKIAYLTPLIAPYLLGMVMTWQSVRDNQHVGGAALSFFCLAVASLIGVVYWLSR